ncbi:helix-turn-helix domain-containing protein [Solihabitans fulvus]|uniref:Helix-turn-helix domain-containing protein n=2 Tax=Solihabitans fulvus TaxID=1892852 RepID=A0A5B2XPA7_9PSEU|nr:helix-turn-helix domain-containing protein [Solihabitans fulvus]
MHRVVVLALDRVYPFELGIPARIFGAARGPDGEQLYEVVTCSLDGGPVATSADFAIVVEHGIEALATADTLVIAPFTWEPPDEDVPVAPADVFDALRPGTRVVSICTAAVLLAAAGLLDGRPATTHWWEAERCQQLFPKVNWDADVLFVDDGDVLTSAGVAAGVDLCVHIVRRDHGSAVANRAARHCVVPPWRDGGQAQYIERPVPGPSTATTAATRAWALRLLDRPLPLTELAGHARMSVRTFSRRFRQEVGMSPGDWLIRQRVELARHLLEDSDLPMDQIARRAGFGTAASLRQHLHTAIGVSPLAYRRTFRAADDPAG